MTQRQTGVWLVGALGGLATTVIAGTLAVRKGLAKRIGLVSDAAEFAGLDLSSLDSIVFGGHDVREGDLVSSAEQIASENGSIPRALVDGLRAELVAVSREIRPGTAVNCGPAVDRFAAENRSMPRASLRAQVDAIERDLKAFAARHDLERVIVINVASTEPPLETAASIDSAAALDAILASDRADAVRASLLYSAAAIRAGCPYVNFTASNAALAPGVVAAAESSGLPVAGSDGKTGETLVKTSLAPMFRHRQLRVLSWQGYNILGDRDGEVLSEDAHRRAKVQSKDRALPSILGYPLHTHVGIDFVPSLKDLKTAWDFVHFEGFLGFPMSLQFTWQGCDSILAAPLVIDLARFMAQAHRDGARGPQRHLACFFKSPLGVEEHDFHRQWAALVETAHAMTKSRTAAKAKGA